MADNIVKRIIQLLLDKDSAKKTQSDVNTLTNAIDSSFKNLGFKIAGYLSLGAAVLSLKKLGAAAIEQATESEKAWRMLKGTIDNTGASFDAMEIKLRATADAFQDATIHDDDAFAVSLTRLVTLTDDVSASLNNMGLVANVAAQFFEGDLAPATDLVAKAMNGNTLALKKLGIQADTAQQALEILASRSFGAAEREAATFDGQLKQMSNSWDDVLKDLGNAIIKGDGATTMFSVLRAAIQTLGDWVLKNQGQIRDWVTNGIKFAIDATDVLIRAIKGMGELLTGGFQSAAGIATLAIGKLVDAWASLREIEDNVREKLGQDVTERRKLTQAIRENAKALEETGKELFNQGKENVAKSTSTFANRLFSSDQFAGGPTTRTTVPGGTNAPQVGKHVKTDESENVRKAIEEFEKAGKTIQVMDKLFGEGFNSVSAEIDRTTKLLIAFAENGVDPTTTKFGDLGAKLIFLKDVTGPVNTALNDLFKSLGTDLAIAAATGASSLDKLQIEANDVQKALSKLLETPNETGAQEAIAALTERLGGLKTAIDLGKEDQAFVEGVREMGDAIREDLVFATLDATDNLTRMRQERQALTRAIQIGIANNRTEDATFKQLVARYKEVTAAIDQQTEAMRVQATAADFLAEALGVALQGGIHEAAAQKAKQTGIEALEWLVRAGAYALFGNAPAAAAALKNAAGFGAVALAWKALSAATPSVGGGGGGGGSSPTIPSSGGGSAGGADVASARSTAGDSAGSSHQPSAEVSVYLVGPGFDMLNPHVQRVVHGASQQAIERYGANAKVRIVPHGES